MPHIPVAQVIEHVRRAVLLRGAAAATDGQLLGRFVRDRDEASFEALVRRHGPMVLGVCRRILGHAHDAEDAFQAAFLVLARKAAAVVPREAVGNWLHGVAYHTALKARAVSLRRRRREKQVQVMPEPEPPRPDPWDELQPILDGELRLLPEKYRLPVVLCDLEGRPRKDVARQLKIPEGTLSSRLTAARRLLARRLARHGLAISGGAAATLLAREAASACVPATLVGSTVTAARHFAAGREAAAGVVSAKAAALAEGVMRSMFVNRLKIVSAVLLVVALAGCALGALLHPAAAAGQLETQTEKAGKGGKGKPPVLAIHVRLEGVNDELRMIEVITTRIKPGQKLAEATALTFLGLEMAGEATALKLVNLPVARDAKITDGAKTRKLADLKPRTRATLELTATPTGGLVVVGIRTGAQVDEKRPDLTTMRLRLTSSLHVRTVINLPAETHAVSQALKRLEGTWVVLKHEEDGKDVPADLFKDHTLVIQDGKYIERIKGQAVFQATIHLDPTQKLKTIDLVHDGAGMRRNQGIYQKVGSDLLIICDAAPGMDRPADFTTAPNSKRRLTVFQRKK
jgi:RNA polymerase sigma factor (sigma-70 family)